MRGSQASAKPRQLLQETEGVEIPLDAWTESLFVLERCKVSLRSGRKGNAFYNQKAEGRHRILTLQTAPLAHLGMTLPRGEQEKHVL